MERILAKAFVSTLLITVSCSRLPQVPTTAPSNVVTCQGRFCFENGRSYLCQQENLECCSGPMPNHYSVHNMRSGMKCCVGSGSMYNFRDSICIAGKIRPRLDDEENCGDDKIYNMSTQVCCKKTYYSGNVYDKVPNGQCCKDDYLTDPNLSCCEGEIYEISAKTCCQRAKAEWSNNVSEFPKQFSLVDIPYGRCCLDVAYNPRNQSCVEQNLEKTVVNKVDQSLPKCGRRERYDNATHGCCLTGEPKVYELRNYICRHGKTYEKSNPGDDEICVLELSKGNAVVTFRSYGDPRQVCLNHKVITLRKYEDVCGSNVYNINTDLCCAGRLYRDGKLSGNTCCHMGTNSYNPDGQICCVNRVFGNIALNNNGQCCRKNPYNNETHSCIAGKVEKKECPPLYSKCNVTIDRIKAMRSKKVFVFIGVVQEMRKISQGSRAKSREWTVGGMQEFKGRKGKLYLAPIRSKGAVTLKAAKCECPGSLQPNTRYVFVTSNGIKRKRLTLASTKKGGDFVIPVTDTHSLGLLFNGLVDDLS